MFGCSSFPMSLADRSFDSDGNCVCVCTMISFIMAQCPDRGSHFIQHVAKKDAAKTSW